MLHVILTIAVWAGGQGHLMPSEQTFTSLKACHAYGQQVAKGVKQRKPEWLVGYSCELHIDV